MPPWHLDKSLGIQHFENDRSLSDAEIDTVVKWVAAGAPKGDMKDMPKPVEWPSDDVWNFEKLYGKPDLVLQSPAYTQKGDAMDAWYKPVQATGLTEERWVRAIEMRPGTVKGRKITHHALARLQQNDGDDGDVDRARRRRTRPRPVHGVGGRQAGRDHARELGQADEARLEDRVGHPLPRRR